MTNKVYVLFESYCLDPFEIYSIHTTRAGAEAEKDRIEWLVYENGAAEIYKYYIQERELRE